SGQTGAGQSKLDPDQLSQLKILRQHAVRQFFSNSPLLRNKKAQSSKRKIGRASGSGQKGLSELTLTSGLTAGSEVKDRLKRAEPTALTSVSNAPQPLDSRF